MEQLNKESSKKARSSSIDCHLMVLKEFFENDKPSELFTLNLGALVLNTGRLQDLFLVLSIYAMGGEFERIREVLSILEAKRNEILSEQEKVSNN